jgi:hypothetical protein
VRYLSAAVALVAMTFSQTALGQTPRAAEIAIAGKAVIGPLSPNAVAGTVVPSTMVPRYTETVLSGFAEIHPDNCREIDPGKWTVTMNPMFGTTSTRIEPGISAGPNCPGKEFNFAEIFYTWTTHNNHTTTPGQGPTDIFNATWSSSDGFFNMSFVFNIVVPVVRPKDETSSFQGWVAGDSRGNWMQTLTPPDDDKGFDFSGEMVQEVFQSNTSSCNGRGLGSLGSTPPLVPAQPRTVMDGNMWGPDQVGFGPCAVEYYRCVKATPCGYTLHQQMRIKSPADNGYTDYTTNTLSANIEGSILPFSNKTGWGSVTSQRGSGGLQSKGWVSDSNSCPPDAVLPC